MSRTVVFLSFILLFYFNLNEVHADETRPYLYTGLRAHYGFIIPHAEEIRGISDSNPRGLEVNIGWHHNGNNSWRYCFCYPRTGIMLSWFSFNNTEILGNALIVTPYIEPFFTAGSTFSASVKAGIGLAYLDNIYDPVTNPKNHFYSTSLSFLIFLAPGINYRLKDNLNLTLTGYYNHISNGGNTQPNKGINYPTASIGFDYYFSSAGFRERSRDDFRTEDKKLSAIRLSVFGTTKEISNEDDRQFAVYGFSPKFSYRFGRLSAVSGGFEFVSDKSLRERIVLDGIPGSDHKRFSVFAGHELLIGKFNFYQELGVYFYAPFKPKDPVYQRYGLEYFIYNNISAGASLKSHRHVADFLDLRISYVF